MTETEAMTTDYLRSMLEAHGLTMQHLTQSVQHGWMSPLEAYAGLRKMEALTKAALDAVKEQAISEL